MKTIKQIADEIGATKTAVQKRIARDPLYTQLSPHITMRGGTKYIDKKGETIIKSAFRSVDKDMDMGIDTGIDRVNMLISIINEQQKTIQGQSDSIRELTKALEHTTASLNAAQALHAGTIKQQLGDGSIPPVIQPESTEAVTGSFREHIIKRFFKSIKRN